MRTRLSSSSVISAVALSVAASIACARHRVAPSPVVSWPPLPTTGFVSGRPATEADVTAGNAAFAMRSQGQIIGKPLPIAVPQYAFHVDEKTGEKAPGIIIQAEEGMGIKMAGIRLLSNGTLLGALYREFEFLGTTPPGPGIKP